MSGRDALVVHGGRPLRGTVRVPGDKSISHRALVLAAIAEGRSRLVHLADGDDVGRTRFAVEQLGVGLRDDADGTVAVSGAGIGALAEPRTVIDCGNSGTTMRMITGLVAGRSFHTVLNGDSSLRTRPMGRVVHPLREMGATIDGRRGGEHAPLAVRGGPLRAVEHETAVASAQVKSALLLAGLQADGRTVVREPSPSRDHTERLLGELGAPVERVDATTVAISRGALRPFELEVPGDPSSAAFFAVAASIVDGSDIVLDDVALNPTRLGFVDVLRRMGAHIEVVETGVRLGEPVGELRVHAAPLHGVRVGAHEIATVLDELPVLAVAAAVAEGATEVSGAAELRVKETDRIAAIDQELTQLGVRVQATPDGFVIAGGARLVPSVLKSHGDHRIALSAAVAAVATPGESTVRGWGAAAVSYPGFEDDLVALLGAP